MSQYNLNEASFDLHPSLKDRTVNQFIINDDGPSDFSFVISRAEDFTETTVDAFALRLASELRKALPKFELLGKRDLTVDGSAAVELHYTWRNGDSELHQRQVAVFVQAASAVSSKALLLTGTSHGAFKDEWNTAFETMLGSMHLHAPVPAADHAAQES
ncbi:DcrB-related protein [Massilia sp. DJPM01]|uniref:DcrB-related protein n=1 Tax=Massilia sp. DJPM01 TaxID=3024404 RepID=UPI00259E4687|nr:DcrB-related protein [Massilia sp. DJPM01]MDM5176221.1 DcrB-related protein [Massilia sp. DJPM01]